RNRREYNDLQRRQRGPAKPIAVPGLQPARSTERKSQQRSRFKYHLRDLPRSGRSDSVAENIAAARFWSDNITDGGEPEQIPIMLVSANFFSALGVAPQLGRTLNADDDTPGHDKVVVMSDALWHRRYGGDPGIVGRTIRF